MVISGLSAIAGILAMFLAFRYEASTAYIICDLFVIVVFSLNFIMAKYASTLYSKLFYALITPFWYVAAIVILGTGFSEGAACVTNLGFIYVFFRKSKLKWPLIFYGAFLTCCAFVYVDTVGTIFPKVDMPFDSIITLLVASLWLILTFEIYRSENELLIEDLQKNNKQLNATTEELEQFTYSASHDLKTPLRNVSSFLDIIERKISNKDYDTVLEDVRFAKKGSKQMYSLVTDILEMTQVRNDLTNDYEKIDLRHVINKVCREVKNQYPSAIIDVNVNQQYTANESHFYILFQNLILNGVKYNESEEAQITIWNERLTDSVIIYVKDNGIGIADEFHEQIFDYFKRLHSNQLYEGTGLGLGLCKKIVESYNGKITVSSKVGEGSTFNVQLPL